MRVIRNILLLGTVSVAALSLTACETMKKTGDAITAIDVPFYGDDDVKAQEGLVMAKTDGCPQVAVVEDLKTLTQFEVPAAPTPGEKISSVAMTGLDTKCIATENTIGVDISVRFDAQLGPQAADWQSQSRSFAYPYFIAVTTPSGEILSKEVFAATIRFDAGETAITQQEKTRQVIPLRADARPDQYEVLIGFQLTADELNYARMMASHPAPETTPVTAAPAYDMAPEAKATPVYPEVKAAPAPAVVATPVEVTPAKVTPAVTKPVEATPVTTTPTPVTTPAPAAVSDTQKPAAESVNPAEPAPAPTTENAVPAMVDPYAPPPTQIIRIKPDGSVEKK